MRLLYTKSGEFEMTKYHDTTSCNKCGGKNILSNEYYDSNTLAEANTTCKRCGFTDLWAYGYFESGTKMVSNCDTYSYGDTK